MPIILPHTAADFRKNEIATLRYICARGFFDQDFEELADALTSYNDRYKGQKGNLDFKFVADFEMHIEKYTHRIILHAEVTGNYSFTTYSIGICDRTTDQLIRRFHFDYDHKTARGKQKAPTSHLQYGGQSGPGHSGKIYLTNNLFDKLSEPRISHPPINLAILLDMVFCEFYDQRTKKIIEDPQWRSLIRDNEEFIFRNYFSEIAGHIGSERHVKENLVRDICYSN